MSDQGKSDFDLMREELIALGLPITAENTDAEIAKIYIRVYMQTDEPEAAPAPEPTPQADYEQVVAGAMREAAARGTYRGAA